MYIKVINGIPDVYSVARLLSDNYQTSFPHPIPDSVLSDYGMYPLMETSAPVPQSGQVVEEAGFVQDANGNWVRNWVVRPATEEELLIESDRIRKARHLAYQQEADPLFFKWQAGEGTQEAWVAKRAEIKARYPEA